MEILEIDVGLLQISTNEVDEVFGELGCDLLLRPVDQMEADVIFKHLRHQAVDAAPDRGKQHQLVAAIGIGFKRALDSIKLPAHLADPLQQLHLFATIERHRI